MKPDSLPVGLSVAVGLLPGERNPRRPSSGEARDGLALAVAIPVVAAAGWMERRVKRLAHQMTSTTTRVFTVDLSEEVEKTHHAPARIRPAAAPAGE